MDDSQAEYALDTTTRLVQHLHSVFPDFTIYEAWPNVWPPADAWPVMVVQLLHAKPVIGPTETDELPETIEVTIMLNQADAAGSDKVRTTTRRHLQNIIQGQDPVNTDQYKTGTLLHELRTYLTLDQWIINTDIDIRYDIKPPKDLPAMVAAIVTLTTWRRVIVQGRT